MSSEETPDILDVLELFGENLLTNLHTALPGRVERYDPATQRADVQPLIRRRVPKAGTDRREWVYEDLPLIPSVRVLHPRGGGAFVHLPIAAGDFVLLVFCEKGIGHWEAGDGSIQDAGDERQHHIAHAVAIPGLYPASRNIPSEDANTQELVIGFEGGAAVRVRKGTATAPNTIVLETNADVVLGGELGAQLMARADRVDVAIAELRTQLIGHAHMFPPGPMGAPTSPALGGPSYSNPPAFVAPATGADQVKGK